MLATLALCVLAQDVPAVVDIGGRVTLPDGSAAAATRIEYTRGPRAGHDQPLDGPLPSPRGPLPPFAGEVQTAADGRFTIRGLEPGTWTLRVPQANDLWLDRTLLVGPGGALDVQLELTRGVQLAGKLLLPEGAALDDLRLDVVAPDRYWVPRLAGFRAKLKPDGSYEVGPLPVTNVRITLNREIELDTKSRVGVVHTLADVRLDSRAEQVQDIDLRASFPGWVRAVVTVDGKPGPQNGLVLLDDGEPDPDWAPTAGGRHFGPWPLLDYGQGLRQGRATVGFAATGSYAVLVVDERAGWAWRRPEPLLVTPGADVRLEAHIELVAGTLQVEDATGALRADTEVRWAMYGCELAGARRHTDARGQLALKLPRGELELFLGKAGQPVTLAWPPAAGARLALKSD